MVILVAVPESITAVYCARVFIDTILCLLGLPCRLVSDRFLLFTAEFWRSVFKTLGTRLKMLHMIILERWPDGMRQQYI